MVKVFLISTKVATVGLLEMKVYDITVFVNDVTNKFLSRASNNIVDLVMWSKFGNSSISMREVIISPIF